MECENENKRNKRDESLFVALQECSLNILSEIGKNDRNKIETGERLKESFNMLKGYPNVISYDCTCKILYQMENCICKLRVGNDRGTGFFCKIPYYPFDKQLSVLITNNHIINKDLLDKSDSKISLTIKGEQRDKNIRLDQNRKKYTNEKYDITIIELKTEDNINKCLELDKILIDDIISNKNYNNQLQEETIYIIQYPEGKLSVSYGIIQGIPLDKPYEFTHSCFTKPMSSGSPILNLDNKVIGIHKDRDKNNYSYGSFLNEAIKEFIKINFKKENDELLNQFNKDFNRNRPKDYNTNQPIKLVIENTDVDYLDYHGKHMGDIFFNQLMKIEFKELKILDLSINNISKIEAFNKKNFENLEKLNLSDNNISDINPLGNAKFPSLKELNLSKNKISNLGIFKDLILDNLEKLNLGNNIIKKIDQLENNQFKELKEFILENNQISDIEVFEKFRFAKLEILNLKKNRIKKTEALKNAKFKVLEELDLDDNEISNIRFLGNKDVKILEAFKPLETLKILNLSNNKITKITDLYFNNFKEGLKRLDISKNKISEEDLVKLGEYIKDNYKSLTEKKLRPQKTKNKNRFATEQSPGKKNK